MYISLNSTLTANRVAWPDFAKLAASTGYGGVDVNLGKAMEAGVDATRSLLSGLKLKPAIVGLPVEYKKEQADFDRDMPKLDEAARFAAAIGCPRMGPGFFRRTRGRKRNSASSIWSGSAQHANHGQTRCKAIRRVHRAAAPAQTAPARVHLPNGRDVGVRKGNRSECRSDARFMALAPRRSTVQDIVAAGKTASSMSRLQTRRNCHPSKSKTTSA
jgi:hypothetical protein